MDIGAAHRLVSDTFDLDAGRFYRPAGNLPLGAGLICSNVRYPSFAPEERKFQTLEGLVYVLSHECDIDKDNDRPFNDYLLICPLIPFEYLVDDYLTTYIAPLESDADAQDAKLASFLAHLAARKVYRLIYLPHCPPSLPFGGVMYLNWISHTHVSEFASSACRFETSLSAYGLQAVDFAVQNHLLRPKAAPL